MADQSIQSFADKVGLSAKTISRVLNNDPKVKASTKERVHRLMVEEGFVPNLHARRLKSKQSYMIGMLYTDYSGYSYATDLSKGIIKACDELFYEVLIRPLDVQDPYNTAQDIRKILNRTTLDGVILPSPLCNQPEVMHVLDEVNIPCLSVGAKIAGEYICCDEMQASEKAIAYLLSLGHTDIAIINHKDSGESAGSWRLQGYKNAFEKAGLSVNPERIVLYDDAEGKGDGFIRTLLTNDRPSAIFAFNDGVAAKVYKYAAQLGIKIPHDLSVIGFDDDPIGEILWPPLTTVSQPVSELGYVAAKKLISKCIGEDKPFQDTNLECKLLLRASVAVKI